MPTSVINGVRLYWEVIGKTGAPLVLVHGSWHDHHNWDTVVPRLSRSFRVLVYDRRGHSQSERPPGPDSLAQDALDLAELMKSLRLFPAHVVGHSLGASIVLRAASLSPDLFSSICVHEPPLFDLLVNEAGTEQPLMTVRQRIASVVERLEAGDMSGGARQFVETIALDLGAWSKFPAETRRIFVFNAPTWLDEMRDSGWGSLDLATFRNLLHRVLLTQGDQSTPFFRAVMSRLIAELPRAESHVFAGAGHIPHVSHPRAYADRITRFVKGLH